MNLLDYIESIEYTQIFVLSMLRRIGEITLDEVAAVMNISKGTLSQLESGKREVTQEQIRVYSDFLQERLHLKKTNLYEVLTELSKDHKVTNMKANENPVNFLFTYLKRVVKDSI